jgi:hypothetical protein
MTLLDEKKKISIYTYRRNIMATAKKIGSVVLFGFVMITASLIHMQYHPPIPGNPYSGFVQSAG